MRKIKPLLIGCLLAATPAVLLGQARPEVGQSVPTFELTGTDGTQYNVIENLEGPRVVIFFRGAW